MAPRTVCARDFVGRVIYAVRPLRRSSSLAGMRQRAAGPLPSFTPRISPERSFARTVSSVMRSTSPASPGVESCSTTRERAWTLFITPNRCGDHGFVPRPNPSLALAEFMRTCVRDLAGLSRDPLPTAARSNLSSFSSSSRPSHRARASSSESRPCSHRQRHRPFASAYSTTRATRSRRPQRHPRRNSGLRDERGGARRDSARAWGIMGYRGPQNTRAEVEALRSCSALR